MALTTSIFNPPSNSFSKMLTSNLKIGITSTKPEPLNIQKSSSLKTSVFNPSKTYTSSSTGSSASSSSKSLKVSDLNLRDTPLPLNKGETAQDRLESLGYSLKKEGIPLIGFDTSNPNLVGIGMNTAQSTANEFQNKSLTERKKIIMAATGMPEDTELSLSDSFVGFGKAATGVGIALAGLSLVMLFKK